MKATVDGKIVAAGDDVIEAQGYQYFPRAAVRMEWLTKAPKTASDLECPHGVQFYDVTVDGKRYARAAWSYEAPQEKMKSVGMRMGFWQDVQVG